MLNYLIVAGNAGPSHAVAASLASSLPAEFLPVSVSWLCIASSGSSCGAAASGTGSLPASIAAGGNVSFLLSATVRPQPTELVIFSASLTRPAGAAGNDASASDTTAVVLFRDDFESATGEAPLAQRGAGVQAPDGLYVAGLRSQAAAELRPQSWLSGRSAAGCRFAVEFLRAGAVLHARQLVAAANAPLRAGGWLRWPEADDLLSLQARAGELRLAGDSREIVSEWPCGESALTLWPGGLAR